MEQSSELELLLDLCKYHSAEMTIRGTTALQMYRRGRSKSISGCVPPLSDLDIAVPRVEMRQSAASAMADFCRLTPNARFLKQDVFYTNLPVADDPLGNRRIENQFEVNIGPTSHENLNSEWRIDFRGGHPEVSGSGIQVVTVAFRDYLYLLRLSNLYPDFNADKVLRQIADEIQALPPTELGRLVRNNLRESQRVERALLKHVFCRERNHPRKIKDYIATSWLERFAAQLSNSSRSIICNEALWLTSKCIAYLNNGILESASILEEEPTLEERHKSKLELSNIANISNISVIADIPLPEWGHHRCCGYSDFALGRSELAIGGLDEAQEFLNLGLLETKDEFTPVHALARSGLGASSLTLDPGFMALMSEGEISVPLLIVMRESQE